MCNTANSPNEAFTPEAEAFFASLVTFENNLAEEERLERVRRFERLPRVVQRLVVLLVTMKIWVLSFR